MQIMSYYIIRGSKGLEGKPDKVSAVALSCRRVSCHLAFTDRTDAQAIFASNWRWSE